MMEEWKTLSMLNSECEGVTLDDSDIVWLPRLWYSFIQVMWASLHIRDLVFADLELEWPS